MRSLRPLPSIEVLSSRLRLEADGSLYWKDGFRHAGKRAGNINAEGYRTISIDGTAYMAHRIVFALAFGRTPAGPIDHKDGAHDNNAPENLREATPVQNCQNRAPVSSLGKGVYFTRRRRSKPFSARITVNGRVISLGSYASADEARAAYRVAAAAHFQDFDFHQRAALGGLAQARRVDRSMDQE